MRPKDAEDTNHAHNRQGFEAVERGVVLVEGSDDEENVVRQDGEEIQKV